MSTRTGTVSELYPPRTSTRTGKVDVPTDELNKSGSHYAKAKGKTNWKTVIIIMIVLTLLLWAVFYYGNFAFVQKKLPNGQTTGRADASMSFWWALIIAAILTVIFAVLKAMF